MRVVLDTNVIVSALIRSISILGDIVRHWEKGTIDLVVSPMLLAEYRRTLNYPHLRRLHGLSDAKLEESIAAFQEAEVVVSPAYHEAVVSADPDDDIFIACAVAGRADYIVSGDRHLLDIGEHQGIRIVLPAVFLALLDDERS